MKHYDFEISLFIDGELPETDRAELFCHLAECEECKAAFSEYLLLKEKSREFCTQKMEKLKNKEAGSNKLYKYLFYASAAAAVILIFLLINIKPEPVYITKTQIKSDTLFVYSKNEPFKQNTRVNTFAIQTKKKFSKLSNNQKLIYNVLNMPSEKITDADRIKPIDRSL